jgi:hypothetical protein
VKKSTLFFWIVLSLSSIPSCASIVIINGLTHAHPIQAGAAFTGKVIVRNDGAKEVRFVVYKQDLRFQCSESYIQYTDANSHSNSLGKWIETNVEEKVLAPAEQYTLFYTIRIPSTLDSAGSYWTMLMIEGVDPVREETTNNGVVVGSKVRYGVQVIADVGVVESPQLSFSDAQILSNPVNTKYLSAKIQNIGKFSTSVKINLEIYNAEGKKTKTIEGLSRRIYPANCNQFDIDLSTLPKGKYEAVLVADNGKDLFGINVSLDI